jgi:hypothetical protein
MALTIDTLGQSLPTEARLSINKLSPIFLEDCRVSALDGPRDVWQIKLWVGRRVRVVNLDDHHQTVRDIQIALRKIAASFTEHCHSCHRADYLLLCAGNETKACGDWVCPDHNESTLDHPRCPGCYVQPFSGHFAGSVTAPRL